MAANTGGGEDPVGAAGTTTGPATANWHAVTGRMFQRAEALLATFAGQPAGAPVAKPVPRWAALMLYETRILLDSPAAADPQLAALLADLELVLAQIAHLSDRSRTTPDGDYTIADERARIAAGLDERATLQRLRDHLEADRQARPSSL